ncbi:uncharacterized protein LOC135808480 [Sycon ciliatum]|uniref:uncharacterized protein LOC135808480 n=1 Tax=Sycon ciliatum TaxID=27933 RepID=UPI0031F6ACD8|eukprot:scpid11321/ scgid35157/ 
MAYAGIRCRPLFVGVLFIEWLVVSYLTSAASSLEANPTSHDGVRVLVNEIFISDFSASSGEARSYVELAWMRPEARLPSPPPDRISVHNTTGTATCVLTLAYVVVQAPAASTSSRERGSFPARQGQGRPAMSPAESGKTLVISEQRLADPEPDEPNAIDYILVREHQKDRDTGDEELLGKGQIVYLPEGALLPRSSPGLIRVECNDSMQAAAPSADIVLMMWNVTDDLALFARAGLTTGGRVHVIRSPPTMERSYSRCANGSLDVAASSQSPSAASEQKAELFIQAAQTPLESNACVPKPKKVLNELSWYQVHQTPGNSYSWSLSFVEVKISYGASRQRDRNECARHNFVLRFLHVGDGATAPVSIGRIKLSAADCRIASRLHPDLLTYQLETTLHFRNVTTHVPLVCILLYDEDFSTRPQSGEPGVPVQSLLDAVCIALLADRLKGSEREEDRLQMAEFAARFNLPFATSADQASGAFALLTPYRAVIRCTCCQSFDLLSFQLSRRPTSGRDNAHVCQLPAPINDQPINNLPTQPTKSVPAVPSQATADFGPHTESISLSYMLATSSAAMPTLSMTADQSTDLQSRLNPVENEVNDDDGSSGDGMPDITILIASSFSLSFILILLLICAVIYFNRQLKAKSSESYQCAAYINPAMLGPREYIAPEGPAPGRYIGPDTPTPGGCIDTETPEPGEYIDPIYLEPVRNSQVPTHDQRGRRIDSPQDSECLPGSHPITLRQLSRTHRSSPGPSLDTITESEIERHWHERTRHIRHPISGTGSGRSHSPTQHEGSLCSPMFGEGAPYQAAVMPSQLDFASRVEEHAVIQNPFFRAPADTSPDTTAEPRHAATADNEDSDSITAEIEVEFRKTTSGRNFRRASSRRDT